MPDAPKLGRGDARPPRLCIVNEFFYPDMVGGTGMVLSDLARSLCDQYGLRVSAITSRNAYRGGDLDVASERDWDGIRIRRIQVPFCDRADTRRRLLLNTRFTLQAALVLAGHRSDVNLVSSAPPMLPMAAWMAKRLNRVPYLYIIYDLEPDRAVTMGVARPQDRKTRALAKWQRIWMHDASKVIVIGRCMRALVSERYQVPDARLEVIEVGADTRKIEPADQDTVFRHRHRLKGFLVLYAGNFGRYHDFETILGAAELLQSRGEQATFVLVGNGVKERFIREEVQAKKLKNVRVMPFVHDEDYSDLLASADVSLVTLVSGMEGLCVPSKFYTTLASGRPTIAVMESRSEVASVVAEAECGVVLPPGQPEVLADALVRLRDDQEARTRMGRNARRVIEERYGYDKIDRKFFEAIQTVLGRPAPRVETARCAAEAFEQPTPAPGGTEQSP